MIHGREELLDICFQHIMVLAGKMLTAIHRCMGTFSLSAGIRVMDKCLIEEGLQDSYHGVMYHPISVGCCANLPVLGFVDKETAIGAWGIGFAEKLVLQFAKLCR